MAVEASPVLPGVVLVAAVALVLPDGRVLLQRRRRDRRHGGLWEFPGGKVEPGEAPDAAARREIREELAVELDGSALQSVSFASGPNAGPSVCPSILDNPSPLQTLVILLYICRRWHGEPACLDAEELGWFEPAMLEHLAMPPLDYPLARALCRALPTLI